MNNNDFISETHCTSLINHWMIIYANQRSKLGAVFLLLSFSVLQHGDCDQMPSSVENVASVPVLSAHVFVQGARR